MKKIKLMLVAFMAMIGVNAFAEDLADGYLRYSVDGDSKATITGFVANAEVASVTIPAQVTDPVTKTTKYDVIAVQGMAFKNQTIITDVTFANKLEAIGISAFEGCTNLATVDFSGATKLADIGTNAFKGTKIGTLNISATAVTYIANWFGTTYKYDATTRHLTQDECDEWNFNIENVPTRVLPGDPKENYTDEQAAAYNLALEGAFDYTNERYVKDDYFTAIGAAVWNTEVYPEETPVTITTEFDGTYKTAADTYNANREGSVAAGDPKSSYTYAEASAFNATQVGAKTTAEEVAVPAVNAVANTTLTTVVLPAKWTTFLEPLENQAGAFENCTALANVTFTTTGANAAIGAKAFKGTGITAATLPASLKVIGASAFEDCAALANFTWAGTVAGSTIGDAAFKNCSALAISATIPQVVVAIGANAFENSGLTGLTFAGTPTLTTIGAEFIKGTKITELNLAISTLTLTDDTDVFYSDKLKKVTFVTYKEDGKTVQAQALNNQIDKEFFSHATALEEIVLGSNITSIEAKAFQVTVLKSLDLSKTGVLTINNIFSATQTAAYKTLTEVILPNNADLAINEGAFAFCTALDKIIFPTKWAANGKVAANAFKGCKGITTVTFKPETPAGFSASGAFDASAFSDCTATISIVTSKAYAEKATTKPTNCDYSFAATTDKPITLNGNFALLKQTKGYYVSAEDAIVYSMYIDGVDGTIYMMPYRINGGNYEVAPGKAVLLKAKNAVDGKITIKTTDDVITGSEALNPLLSALTRSADNATTAVSTLAVDGKFVNIAAIKNGVFGFTSPAGTTLAAKTYYVLSPKEYGAAGARIVWLDQDDDITAIIGAKKAVKEDGVIYNLAGQKVSASYKGVVIKNGKKYIQK